MKIKLLVALPLILLLLVTQSLSASESEDYLIHDESCKNTSIYFFYGEGCPHCIAIEPIVKATSAQCEISFKSYEVYHNETNRQLLTDFAKRYCRNATRVPAIFVGDSALIGDEQITKNLYDKIISAKENNMDALHYSKNCSTTPPPPPPLPTIATVIGAALVDSINPCAIGVLIIFITFMTSSMKLSRRRIAIYGAIYITAVYLAYFLAGVGILKFFHSFESMIFVQILVVIILLVGILLSFRDTYLTLTKKGKPLLAIPASAKGTIERYIKRGTILGVIALGVLVAMVELPCTGQVYLGILTVLNTIDFNYGILLLSLYNFIFVLPLILILIFGLFGRTLSEFSEKKQEESWLMRYLAGWVMIFLTAILMDEIFKFFGYTGVAVPDLLKLTYEGFFIFAVASIVSLFVIFSLLRPIVKKRINIWYCSYCYASAITWIFLSGLYLLGVDVPKILIAGLLGMSLAGIWEEFKKFNFKYFGVFTIFSAVFGIILLYVLSAGQRFEFLLLVLPIFVLDGIIFLKNFEIMLTSAGDKGSAGKGAKRWQVPKEEKKGLREMLDHCCD